MFYEYKNIFLLGSLLFFTFSGLLYWYSDPQGHYEVDSPSYDRIARIFLETGTMSDVDKKPPIHTQGYHFFLAMIYKCLGIELEKLIFIQIILAFLSIMLVTRMAYLLFKKRCALIVFLLAILDPAFYVYPQFMLAETVLLFLLCLFFERLALFYKTKHKIILAQSGFVLGISMIVKPTALFLPFVLLFMFLFFSMFKKFSCSWKDYSIFLITTYVPVVLYIIRNGITFGYYKFSFLSESGLLLNFHALLYSKIKNVSFDESLIIFSTYLSNYYSCFDSEYWHNLRDFFYKNIIAHPCIVLKIWFQNVAKTFFGFFTTQLHVLCNPSMKGLVLPFFESQGTFFSKLYHYFEWTFRTPVVGILMLIECITNGFKWLFVGFGLRQCYQEKSYEFLIFCLSVIACFSLVTGFFGAGRYRITFEPLLLIIAAQGIENLYKFYKRYRSRESNDAKKGYS